MNKQLSLAFSYIFHPLLMPTMIFVLLYIAAPEIIKPFPSSALPFLFFTTFLIPTLSISILKKLGSIRSLSMKSREERVMPFFFICVFFGMTTYMFIFRIHVNEIVALILISTFFLLLLLSIITIWFKISIHAAASAGVTGYLTALVIDSPNGSLFYPFIFLFLLTGLVMTARLALNAHTPKEIWSGALIGFVICFGFIFLLS